MATDRLSTEKQYADVLLKELVDEKHMLNLNEETRISAYLFAFSIGVSQGKRTPLENTKGLILEQSIRENEMSLLYSVALNEMRKNGTENTIVDKEIVYKIADEYANTGFKLIQEMIPEFDKYDEENFQYEMIQKLDDVYELITNERKE